MFLHALSGPPPIMQSVSLASNSLYLSTFRTMLHSKLLTKYQYVSGGMGQHC